MNSSPERNTFHSECRRKDAVEAGRNPDTDPAVLDALATESEWIAHTSKIEADPRWRENNLEYDLRSNKWICDKAKASESYAQNVYAALCNQDWQRNDIWPRLKGQTYSCSWRYAGGIVADMIEQGDYIDWYCSGIRGGDEPDVYKNSPLPCSFVPEGTVTDEIRKDFFELGWIPVDNYDE